MATKKARITPSSTEIRAWILDYFFSRYKSATSSRGKRGFAAKIGDVRKDLKSKHGLTQQEVVGNLHYLLSQGWVAEERVTKNFPLPSGAVVPQETSFFKITAAGIDKIEGAGEFTMPRFHGIKIEATGQNIITLGDGNQVNARFGELAGALSALRNAVVGSKEDETTKMSVVADIDTIQSQLAKPSPNRRIVASAWEAVEAAATMDGVAGFVSRVTSLIGSLLS